MLVFKTKMERERRKKKVDLNITIFSSFGYDDREDLQSCVISLKGRSISLIFIR